MAVCTTQQIADLARCFLCLSPATLKAIRLLATYREAAALGYDVDASIAGIVAVTECYAHCSDPNTILAAEAAIAVQKANTVGAELPTGTTDLQNLVNVLEKVGDVGTEGALAAVLCTMGAHTA